MKVISAAAVMALASATVLTGLAAPAFADDSSYCGSTVASCEPKPCNSGSLYAVGWVNGKDFLFGRDCKADGYGILVKAKTSEFTVGEVWDHGSAGNGAWRDLSGSYPHGIAVKLYLYKSQNGIASTTPFKTIGGRDYVT